MAIPPLGIGGAQLPSAVAVAAKNSSPARLPIARPVRTTNGVSPTTTVLQGSAGAQIQAYAAAFAAVAAAATVRPALAPTPPAPRVAPVEPLVGIVRIDVYA